MSTEVTGLQTENLREQAVKRLQKKRDFHIHLLIYTMVNATLVLVWWMTGAPWFWPIIPIAAWGIGVVANAWDAYGRVPTEHQIQQEMERLARR
jgi:hypothetical protein